VDEHSIRELLGLISDAVKSFSNKKNMEVLNYSRESLLTVFEAVELMPENDLKIELLSEIDSLAENIGNIYDQLNALPRPSVVLLSKYYDYCFLRYMHERLNRVEVDTIIVGSSHALNGIDESFFEKGCVNLSMHSQDLYYDFVNAKKAISSSKAKIKKCVIVMGYYIIAQDVSLESRYGHEMIKRVYAPLLKDTHNWSDPECEDIWNDKDLVLSKAVHTATNEEVWSDVCNWFDQNPTYYNSFRKRGNGIFDFGGKKWSELSAEERDAFGKRRTDDHNKILKYEKTIEENFSILKELIAFLDKEDVKPYIVITPFSDEYNKYILPKYKELISSALKQLPNNVCFIDMNDKNLCNSDDFVDTDHLNGNGAKKVSKYIVENILK